MQSNSIGILQEELNNIISNEGDNSSKLLSPPKQRLFYGGDHHHHHHTTSKLGAAAAAGGGGGVNIRIGQSNKLGSVGSKMDGGKAYSSTLGQNNSSPPTTKLETVEVDKSPLHNYTRNLLKGHTQAQVVEDPAALHDSMITLVDMEDTYFRGGESWSCLCTEDIEDCPPIVDNMREMRSYM